MAMMGDVESILKTERDGWDGWNIARVKDRNAGDRSELTRIAIADFRRLVPREGSRVLDVGVGAGWTTHALYRQYDYLGLDFAPKSIAAAREMSPGAKLEVADFVEWPAPEEAFEAILCVDTIACIRDQEAAFKKFFQTLKPGGTLLLTTVNPDVYGRLAWVKRAGPPKWFRKWLSDAELRGMLERCGFRIFESRTILPTGDNGLLRVLNSRKVRGLLGERYLRFLEARGYGQYRIAAARKPCE